MKPNFKDVPDEEFKKRNKIMPNFKDVPDEAFKKLLDNLKQEVLGPADYYRGRTEGELFTEQEETVEKLKNGVQVDMALLKVLLEELSDRLSRLDDGPERDRYLAFGDRMTIEFEKIFPIKEEKRSSPGGRSGIADKESEEYIREQGKRLKSLLDSVLIHRLDEFLKLVEFRTVLEDFIRDNLDEFLDRHMVGMPDAIRERLKGLIEEWVEDKESSILEGQVQFNSGFPSKASATQKELF